MCPMRFEHVQIVRNAAQALVEIRRPRHALKQQAVDVLAFSTRPTLPMGPQKRSTASSTSSRLGCRNLTS